MEDKILIASKRDIKTKNLLFGSLIIVYVLTVACITILTLPYKSGSYIGWDLIFDQMNTGEGQLCTWTFVFGCFILIASIVITIVYHAFKKCEMSITDKSIKGVTLFGKESIIPLHMISGFTTKKFFSLVTILTGSGKIWFPMIENYTEIGEIISKKINERQANTEATPSSADELKKFKELLDMGIITQEEFDAKKKQLLGL